MKLRKLLSFLFIAVPMMLSAQVIEINDIRFPDDYVQCHANQLPDDAMDAFVATLPQNPSEGKISIYIRDEKDTEEGYVCTQSQADAIKAK